MSHFSISAQNPNINPTPNVVPPAPNVAALGKFGDVPVSGYTGVPNIGIDLESIEGAKLSVPISIKYHAGGIRVNDVSSVVGLSWALNAGGSISRTVKGLPDEGAGGYITSATPASITPTLAQIGANLSYYEAAAEGRNDVEPDMFSFNVGNYSGKFVFDATPAHNIKLIPYQNIKIVPTANWSSWTITTPDGTIYTFGAASDNTVVQYTDNSSTFTSAWHLSTITTPNNDDLITFTYEGYVSNNYQKSFSRSIKATGGLCTPNGGGLSITQYSVYGKTIKTISSIKGKVVFNYLGNSDVNIDKRLTSIVYYGHDLTTVLKSYNLGQGYYQAGTEKRLRLDNVQEFGSDGVTSKTPHTFSYLNTGVYVLPQQQSYAQDHWGFYNGADGNNTLLPQVLASSYSLAQSGADRTPNRETTKAGIIQQITYPTGGYSTFEFECHEFNGSDNAGEVLPRKQSTEPIAGGLRIKQINSFDGVQTTIKKYAYKSFSSTTLSSGVLLSPIAYTYNQTFYSTGPAGCFTGDIECGGFGQSSSSTIPLSMGQGSHVVYPQVTEYLGQNGEFGKTEYTFSNPTDNYSINYYIPAITSYDWGRGLLEKKEDYTYIANNNTYVKVQKTENIYNMRDTAGLVNNGRVDGLVIRFWKKPPCASVASPQATFTTWFQWQAYSHISRWFYLQSSTTTSYDLAGASPVTTTSTTAYRSDGVHTFPVQTTVTNSNQVTNISKIYYPQDIKSTHPNFGIVSEFVNRYMIGVPLQTEQIIGNSLSGGILEFQKFESNNQMFYPFKYWAFNRDGTKTLKVTIDEYFNPTFTYRGMPKKVTTFGFSASDNYTWSDKKQLSTKIMKNTANTIQLTSAFTYKAANYLVESIIDENGLIKKFGYDKFMRLETVKDRLKPGDDNDYQAMTTYKYHYKGEVIPNNPTPDDINRNFVGTTSNFKGVTAPLSTKQYLDGLGRPIEVVKELYTPPTASHSAYWNQKNYVSYDLLGRQSRAYLPFETGTLGFENSNILLNAAGYVETAYEASPLSRPISQRNADGTFTYMAYGANDANDAVQILIPSAPSSGNVEGASSSSVYAINSLYKTTMTDENGKKTCVFKDKLGRVILTRKFLNGATGDKVDTYNVYDDYGQLVVVVPPGALTLGANFSATVVNDLTFQYKYDNKNRLIEKKIPGAKSQRFYYDSRDLLVLTQDGNMAAESATKHLATLYDDIGRVKKTGFVNVSPTQGVDYTTDIATLTMDKLTETIYYPNKSWVKHQGAKVLKSPGISTSTNFVWAYTERRAGLEYTGNPIWQGKQHLRYASQNMSQLPITDNDTYGVDWSVSGYNGMQQPDLTIRYLFEGGVGEVRTWQNFTYDNGRRLTDIKYAYGTGGAGISSPTGPSLSNMVYNFKDQLVEKNIGLTSAGALQSIDYQYNIRGWLTNINNVALNGNGSTNGIWTPQSTGSSPIQNLAITPFIHKAVQDAVSPYRAANANELPPLLDDTNTDLFSQVITYNNPYTGTGATPQYNGNISSTLWQVAGRDKQAYGFAYDGLDRMTQANYFDITELYYAPYTSTYSTDNKFKEAVQYDVRGNIVGLQRFGLNAGTFTWNGYTAATYGMIDNLVYNYKPNPTASDLSTVTTNTSSNKLLNVKDASLINKGFKYMYGNAAPTYTYDDNGNLTSDLNKNIINITYNYLNLPMKITFGRVGEIDFNEIYFVYDATGQKHQKITYYYINDGTELEDVNVYDYINGVEYINGYLKRIAHSEGAVVRDAYSGAGVFEQEYVLRDHLGNTRVSFKDVGNDGVINTADIKQINHYYPFGLNMEGNWQGGLYGQNKYQYNGKELNQDFGLDWNDYGARFYDPALARWTAVDPLADMYKRWSPYNYAMNNPVKFTDPDGRGVSGDYLSQNGEYLGSDGLNDGKVYLMKTSDSEVRDTRREAPGGGVPGAGLSTDKVEAATAFIKENNGNADAFNKSDIKDNFVEIEGKQETREAMLKIVNQDDGSGNPDAASNNREFQGSVFPNGSVNELPAGPVSYVRSGAGAGAPYTEDPSAKTRFHSHPSAVSGGNAQIQHPSSSDISNTPSGQTRYVFGQRDDKVYIYNSSGVQAIMDKANFGTIKK